MSHATILVVDDEQLIRWPLAERLRSEPRRLALDADAAGCPPDVTTTFPPLVQTSPHPLAFGDINRRDSRRICPVHIGMCFARFTDGAGWISRPFERGT
jgi:hypothetical protein